MIVSPPRRKAVVAIPDPMVPGGLRRLVDGRRPVERVARLRVPVEVLGPRGPHRLRPRPGGVRPHPVVRRAERERVPREQRAVPRADGQRRRGGRPEVRSWAEAGAMSRCDSCKQRGGR